ncbi:hypothetical protein Pcinc_025636 [Petrolisthes cinctipes]|uniref:Transmembrane protein 185B n=1 Tax=Petrolisthes cinctipes TaxID=88211 RepID=A0AAE1F9H5_PETCI|nr:hypothetical protein Pcinc_025636 [Petrolisthes cinctipes]
MNLQSMFRDFNPGKLIVWVCLGSFTALLALRLDGELDWSYWAVFSPIWVWKALVVLGALVGNIVWLKNPQYRLEGQSYIQYRALLISLGLHLFLLMFEVLAADKLENHRHAWVSVFAPLILISIVSIAACIWAVKHDRSFELELFCSVNLLQFIFIALRLDEYIRWPWEIVLVPAWILLCVSVVAVLYSIIFAGLLLRMHDVNPDRRRTSMNSAIGYTCLVAPLLIFLITLASKLNGNTSATYTSVVSPLYISYTTLILMSFTTKRANQWWFGLRKDVCQFLLGVCPLLQEYANISYSLPQDSRPSRTPQAAEAGLASGDNKRDGATSSRRLEHRVVVPALSLEVPD